MKVLGLGPKMFDHYWKFLLEKKVLLMIFKQAVWFKAEMVDSKNKDFEHCVNCKMIGMYVDFCHCT